MKNQGKGQRTNKKYKGKEKQSNPNQTIGKKELKFAPVSRNANYATYSTVKDAFLLRLQEEKFRSMAYIVKAMSEEKEPDWEEMRPEKMFFDKCHIRTGVRTVCTLLVLQDER